MIIKRDADGFLDHWYAGSGRKPLLVRGARQVGKSTLVRAFARRRKLPLFEVNLERHSRLDAVFASLDVTHILRELEFVCGQGQLTGGLLFLDEIQATPQALKALRYLYEDRPDLAVIAAGSLVEFTLNAADFTMPVGRLRYFHLSPLGFHEFLNAIGEADLAKLISTWRPPEDFPLSAHLRLLGHLRDFFLVGGMPEAVSRFAAGQGLNACLEAHLSILDTYRDDFGKYASKVQVGRLRRLLDYVPLAVGEKFRYVRASPHDQAKDVRQAIELLAMAGIVGLVHHSDANGTPLGAEADAAVFKPLFLDVGLMNAACGIRTLPQETLHDRRFVNTGKMVEQFVGQQLLAGLGGAQRPRLHYWLREGRQSNAEVDFLLEAGGAVIPVEVKAGASGALKSLHQFMALKTPPLAFRLDITPPSRQTVAVASVIGKESRRVAYPLYSFPLYLAGQAERIAVDLLGQA